MRAEPRARLAVVATMVVMSPITAEEASRNPLTTEADVQARVDDLVGRACRRQLWLLFLDSEDVQVPLLVPLEDHPPGPGDGNAERVAERASELGVLAGAASVVVVWERRLGEASTPGDRAWARALDGAFVGRDLTLRAQYLSHRTGTRRLAASEYGGSVEAPPAEDVQDDGPAANARADARARVDAAALAPVGGLDGEGSVEEVSRVERSA